MTSQRMILTAADVARLLQDPSERSRVVTANKVASAYSQADLLPRERALARQQVGIRKSTARAMSASLAWWV